MEDANFDLLNLLDNPTYSVSLPLGKNIKLWLTNNEHNKNNKEIILTGYDWKIPILTEIPNFSLEPPKNSIPKNIKEDLVSYFRDLRINLIKNLIRDITPNLENSIMSDVMTCKGFYLILEDILKINIPLISNNIRNKVTGWNYLACNLTYLAANQMFAGLCNDRYILPMKTSYYNQLLRITSFYGLLSSELDTARKAMTNILKVKPENLEYNNNLSQMIIEKASTISFEFQ